MHEKNDKLGGALRATLKIGEARARDVTHFEACELAIPVYASSWCGGTSRRPGRKPRACMGVDRGRLAPSSLRSTRCLDEQHQQSYLSSHARA